MYNLNADIVTGLIWLRKLKPVIEWESSVLTFSRNIVNIKIYPISVIYWMKDYIFVCLVKTEPSAN